MVQHKFTMDLTWSEGRNGTGNIQASNLQTQISIPRNEWTWHWYKSR